VLSTTTFRGRNRRVGYLSGTIEWPTSKRGI